MRLPFLAVEDLANVALENRVGSVDVEFRMMATLCKRFDALWLDPVWLGLHHLLLDDPNVADCFMYPLDRVDHIASRHMCWLARWE